MSEEQTLSDEKLIQTSIYSNIVGQLIDLNHLSNRENEQLVLQNGIEFTKELLMIMDEHKDDPMNKETVLNIEKGVQALLTSLTRINLVKLFENDSISAKQLFYSYLNLLNLSPMKIYLQRQQFHSILYGKFLSIILSAVTVLISCCKFTIDDLEEPKNNREMFLLMLNYMKDELDPQSSLSYSTTTKLIFTFLWSYADKTVLIPNLIQVGFPESILKWLSHFIQ